MKTAMQEMFANIEDDKGLYEAWEWIMANKENLLKIEKRQIIKAWTDHRYNKWGNENMMVDGENYYNENYTK